MTNLAALRVQAEEAARRGEAVLLEPATMLELIRQAEFRRRWEKLYNQICAACGDEKWTGRSVVEVIQDLRERAGPPP